MFPEQICKSEREYGTNGNKRNRRKKTEKFPSVPFISVCSVLPLPHQSFTAVKYRFCRQQFFTPRKSPRHVFQPVASSAWSRHFQLLFTTKGDRLCIL